MKSKAKMNYWVDVVIAVAFIVSIVSGLILYLGPSGGYQGGRNPAYGQTVLLLSHHQWSELHTWSSIAMAAGAFLHLVLHWSWLVCMTKNLFKKRNKARSLSTACPNPSS